MFDKSKVIYYYKDANGTFHFSTGAVREERRAGEYLRMLRFSKRTTECLYLDNPEDYRIVRGLFGIPEGTPWQKVYNNEH